MSRASFAVFLAVSLAVIQAVTVRPAAQAGPTPQAGATQDAGQQPAAAQPAAQGDASQQPTFRAGVNFVRVDVIVHDGITLVAEMPHRFGRSDKRDELEAARSDGHHA
jgi:hypothetical protein